MGMRPLAVAASGGSGRPEVTGLTIAEVLAEKIGLPLEMVTGYLEGKGRSGSATSSLILGATW